jgi:hypothetical protein
VSRHSPVLHALMHSQMKDSQENRTRLSNVDWDTFTRFAEFIYGGDYNAPKVCVVLGDAEVEKPRAEIDSPKAGAGYPFGRPAQTEDPFDKAQEEDAEPEWLSGWTSKKKRLTRGGRIPIQKQLPPLATLADFLLPANNSLFFPKIGDTKSRNDALMCDFTEAFCHVRLYAFAEHYQVKSLKNLALRKLHKALMDTIFHSLRVSELVQLLKLAYQSTPDLSPREEPLRDLLTYYVAWNFEALAPMKDLQSLLEAGGTSVNDICQKVCRWIKVPFNHYCVKVYQGGQIVLASFSSKFFLLESKIALFIT